MIFRSRKNKIFLFLLPLLAFIASLIMGSVLILLAGKDPVGVFTNFLAYSFGFSGFHIQSPLLIAFQFSVPLILNGLSTTVAFRSKFISLGQLGQMLFGAAFSAWIGSQLFLPSGIHAIFALLGGAAAGAFWGWLPAIIKLKTGGNEVLVTLILNPIAALMVGFIPTRSIMPSAQLMPLVEKTKLSSGFLIAIVSVLVIYYYLWHISAGYEQRMAGEAPQFAKYGGISTGKSIIRSMMISGALAGLAGSVEVLGVYYHFVSSFSAVTEFDGIIVGLLGILHPIGILLAGVFLGGLRAGALIGLQIQSGIPRELGNILISLSILFLANEQLFKEIVSKLIKIAEQIFPGRSSHPPLQ